jgi:GNAT superfamily N-acetyltransferase
VLEESIGIHKHLAPWLGALYVCEERRHHGFGRYLIEAGVEEARKLRAEQLYIGIRKAEDYYIRLGWQIFERTVYHNEEITIMRLELCYDEA